MARQGLDLRIAQGESGRRYENWALICLAWGAEWGIRIDESFFLGGLDKGVFLREFAADIFFDDQQQHCNSASKYVPTGHVPSGIKNE